MLLERGFTCPGAGNSSNLPSLSLFLSILSNPFGTVGGGPKSLLHSPVPILIARSSRIPRKGFDNLAAGPSPRPGKDSYSFIVREHRADVLTFPILISFLSSSIPPPPSPPRIIILFRFRAVAVLLSCTCARLPLFLSFLLSSPSPLPVHFWSRSDAINQRDYKSIERRLQLVLGPSGRGNFVSVAGIEKWNAVHALFRPL